MTGFTVVLRYSDGDSNMWCECVDADDPSAAIEAAKDACADGNGWEPRENDPHFDDHWNDVIVFEGECKVVA